MFQWRKKRRKRGDDGNESDDVEGTDESDSDDEVGGESDKMEWGKYVEPELRKWIETTECRRDVADEYFNNPRRPTCK